MRYQKDYQKISLAGLGTTQFWSSAPPEALSCVREALGSYGLTLIDTAEMYADGMCEKRLEKALRDIPRDSYYLLDKGGRVDGILVILPRRRVQICSAQSEHWRGKA